MKRRRRNNPRTRRGVILPAVLFILILLGLLSGIFMFRVNSDLAATQSKTFSLQTRLAAEAGVERVKMLLRTARFDPGVWYDNPDELHRIIVWTPGGERKLWGTDEDLPEGTAAYRFSIVADDPTDDEDFIRFGITDEAAKLNINTATEAQLLILVQAATADMQDANPQEIVDAILDWRDTDDRPRGQAGDTEGEYYRQLEKPYRVKNGPFDTVEELLLVKGVTREILYGEDVDRNGLLTPNEDDGDASYPPDNQDGRLNRGLYPYLTAQSFETNVSNDQRPRVSMMSNARILREQLDADFPDRPETVDQIIQAIQNQRGGNRRQTESEARRQREREQRGRRVEERRREDPRKQPPQVNPTEPPTEGGEIPEGDAGGGGGGGKPIPGLKQQVQQQVRPERAQQPPRRPRDPRNPRPNTENEGRPVEPESPGSDTKVNPEIPEGEQGKEGSAGQVLDGENPVPDQGQGKPGGSNDAPPQAEPMRSPASLFRPHTDENGNAVPSDLDPSLLPVLMDRLTMLPAQQQRTPGLINVNTAPPLVLRCVEGLTESQIEAIVARRTSLDAASAATTAWLVTEGIMDIESFDRVAPQITARGQQFTIEALGYADHLGMVTRLEVVVDMVGPLAQTIYYRDISYLGASFPIREKADARKKRVR